MNVQELQDIILRNTTDISEIRQQLTTIQSKEQRVQQVMQYLRQRLRRCLDTFYTDQYKTTDQRLLITALANEILIFDRLGYDLGASGSEFLLGVAAFLEGRNLAALEYFEQFLHTTDSDDRNYPNAYYLAAMITYNRREFQRAIEFFKSASERSPGTGRAWQSIIYVGELAYFMRKPTQEIERIFRNTEDGLMREEGPSHQSFPRATLYLKLGNCYVGTFVSPKEPNLMVDNQIAIRYYKQARKFCPPGVPAESLLPAVIDYSLASALLLANYI